MSLALVRQLWNKYGIGLLLVALLVGYGLYLVADYLRGKGLFGSEGLTSPTMAHAQPVASSSAGFVEPQGALEGDNEVFASVAGGGGKGQATAASQAAFCQEQVNALLPRDAHSEWAQLNPSGQGDLANINLLKAGYHIGIDTVGQSMRNANLQERSEPPNPQINTGIWNQSTITNDMFRPPLEIGQGAQ